MASSMAFRDAALAWRELLADPTHHKVMEDHASLVLSVAMALARPTAEAHVDWAALRSQLKTPEEEQPLLALACTVEELVEVIVRERLAFLFSDSPTATPDDTSASQRERLAQQSAAVEELPDRFRLEFLETLRGHWTRLQQAAEESKPRGPTLAQFNWRVVRPFVLMRFVLSDGRRHVVKASQQQFHQLRYHTAKVLQEMNRVEAHPIMRLARMEQDNAAIDSASSAVP
ncbi:hypothetical protein ATCC90586_003976 [Pythium insidiosum]|nr:hypothetical protein ATCC90586_003976 [Pythium insidiosum]